MPAALRTVTLTGVELVRVGTWAAATGVTTVTLDDLRSMLAAAADPEVDAAAVRIGHLDPRFDGEPALGWVTNLRVDDQRGALVGDLTDVPAELAELIPRAFRRRSVEIGWNVRTPSGKRYRAALTGLALLGVQPPAVKGLADVIARYSAADPNRAPRTTAGDEMFVVDDDAGGTDTAQALATARAALAALHTSDDPIELGDPPADPAGGNNVPITDERLRELLGVEAEADLEQSIRALRTRAENPNPGDPGGGNGEGEPATPPPGPGTGDPANPTNPTPDGGTGDVPDPQNPPPPNAGAPEPVLVSAAALSALQQAANEGAEARRILRAQEVERELTSALSAGRIAPPDVDHWRAELGRNFEGARTLLSKLSAVFPTGELGSDVGETNGADAAWAAWEQEVFGIAPPSGK